LHLTRDRAEFQTVKILNKYALQEHVGPLCFALGALTSLLLLNYIAKNIGNLVGKGLPWTVIGEFVGLSVPFTVAMTMPMAVLVAVLYAFSRLAAENEITALKASGVALSQLLTPVLLGAAAISVAMIAFNDQVLPRSNHQLRSLMEDIARKKPTFSLHAQVINAVSPGKLYLRAGRLDEASDKMREVVIYDLGDPARRRTIFADSGTMALTPDGDLALTLFDGSMEEVQKTNPGELQRLYYIENHIRVRGVGNTLTRSTNDTYKSEREMSICEMQDVAAQAEQDQATIVQEIEHSLVNGVRIATTGSSGPAPLAPGTPGGPPFRAQWGLGRAYCDFTKWAFHRRGSEATATTAAAATGPGAGGSTGGPGTGAKGAAPPSAGGVATARNSPVNAVAHPPAPAPTPARATVPAVQRPATSPPAPPATQSSAAAGAGQTQLTSQQPSAASPGTVAGGVSHPPPKIVLPKPRIIQVTPSAAAVSLTGMSATLEAARARIDGGQRTFNTYDVEIQKKFAIAVACAIFVLLGAPIALRFPRGGVGLVIGVSFGVFGLYYVGLIAGEPLAQAGKVTPFWAMWGSNVIFLVIGGVLLSRVGRAGSTARGGDLGEIKDAIRAWLTRARRPLPASVVPPERTA
jgi:lipopolysaccharide export system permease protein